MHNPELFFEKYKTYWQRNPIYKLSQDNLVIVKESYENAVKLTKESK